MFDFIESVLRWTNRVEAYVLLLATDRYPPFRLSPDGLTTQRARPRVRAESVAGTSGLSGLRPYWLTPQQRCERFCFPCHETAL
jgi:hypothetical protein